MDEGAVAVEYAEEGIGLDNGAGMGSGWGGGTIDSRSLEP